MHSILITVRQVSLGPNMAAWPIESSLFTPLRTPHAKPLARRVLPCHVCHLLTACDTKVDWAKACIHTSQPEEKQILNQRYGKIQYGTDLALICLDLPHLRCRCRFSTRCGPDILAVGDFALSGEKWLRLHPLCAALCISLSS